MALVAIYFLSFFPIDNANLRIPVRINAQFFLLETVSMALVNEAPNANCRTELCKRRTGRHGAAVMRKSYAMITKQARLFA